MRQTIRAIIWRWQRISIAKFKKPTAFALNFGMAWRLNGLAEGRSCKRQSLQKNAPTSAEISRCCITGAHGVLGEQSAPNKHINAHTLCALNVACLGGNYAADLRVILPAISAQGKTPLDTDAPH